MVEVFDVQGVGRNGLNVIEGPGASPQVALLEIIQMDPTVGSEFDALLHRHSFVVCARILLHGVMIVSAGPQNGRAFSWFDLYSNLGEVCLSSFFNIRQIQKECQNSRTT